MDAPQQAMRRDMVSEIRARLDAASAESQPIGALSALARTLRDDGMSHDSIRECFDAHRARRESDADLTVYEATLDVMQSIDGWFAEEGAQIREARSSDMNGYRTLLDRKSTRLNSSHPSRSRMPSSA